MHLAVGHQQKLVRGAFEQMPIVRHHQYRTAELLQGHGQRQTHFEIKVVSRFVEQQQVRTTPRNQRQRKTGLFAARKIQHRLINARTTEVETTEEVAQGLFTFSRRQSLQMQQRAGFGVQRIELVLGKVAYDQILATGQPASQRRQLAREVFDQRRFARPVGAQQTDAGARHQLQFDLLQNGFVAIPQTGIGQIQQRAGELHGFTEHEVERRIDMGRAQFFHALKCLDPALCLTCLGGLSLETGDVAFHVRTLRLLLLVSLLLLGQTFGTGALEG